MCQSCYEKYGNPQIVSAATLETARAIKEVFRHNSVGGGLHCVVDDWNISDQFILEPVNIYGQPSLQFAAEERCLALMQKLSLPERASALAIYDGYLPIADDLRKTWGLEEEYL